MSDDIRSENEKRVEDMRNADKGGLTADWGYALAKIADLLDERAHTWDATLCDRIALWVRAEGFRITHNGAHVPQMRDDDGQAAFGLVSASTELVIVVCNTCGEQMRYTWTKADREDYATLTGFTGYCLANAADEHACRDDAAICADVAARLRVMGFDASDEHTGGNVWCVKVAEPLLPRAAWYFGNGSDVWGGSLTDEGEDGYSAYDLPDADTTLDTDVDANLDAPERVADALAAALTAWRATHTA